MTYAMRDSLSEDSESVSTDPDQSLLGSMFDETEPISDIDLLRDPTTPTQPKPEHMVPLLCRKPSSPAEARCDLGQLVSSASRDGCVRFGGDRHNAVLPPGDDYASDPGPNCEDKGIVFSVNKVSIDLSAPTAYPQGIETLSLEDVKELHQMVNDARQKTPIDLVIQGRILGVGLHLLVDSGSTVSILSRRLWNTFRRDNPHMSLIPSDAVVRTASGEQVPVVGKVALEVGLCGEYYPWVFYVMDSAESVILGMDFLSWWDVACDCRRGTLTLRGREIQTQKRYSTGDGKVRRLTIFERTVLKPNRHTMVEVKVNPRKSVQEPEPPDWGVVNPAKAPIWDKGVIAGRALVDGHAQTVIIPMLNPTNDEVILYREALVAFMAPALYVDQGPDVGYGTMSEEPSSEDESYADSDDEERHEKEQKTPESTDQEITELKVPLTARAVRDISGGTYSADHTVPPAEHHGDSAAECTRTPESGGTYGSAKPHDHASRIEELDCGCLQEDFLVIDRDNILQGCEEKTSASQANQGVLQAKRLGVPEHLQDLFSESIEELDTEADRERFAEFLITYQGAFAVSAEDLGRTGKVRHRIDTGAHPPIRQPPRRLPLHKRATAWEEIEKMLKKGIIEPCDGPWSSPIVLVTKECGDTRFCVDFREVNNVTKKDAYPLPRIEDNLDALHGSKWFSTLDLLSGFWQVEVEPQDRDKTAFTVGGAGLFRFVTMPFGLCNAPATFQRLMEKILLGLQWTIAVLYIDDIIVFSATIEEHLIRLGHVLSRLLAAGMKLKPLKCRFFRRRLPFLGHVVSAQGVEVDPQKVAKVVA